MEPELSRRGGVPNQGAKKRRVVRGGELRLEVATRGAQERREYFGVHGIWIEGVRFFVLACVFGMDAKRRKSTTSAEKHPVDMLYSPWLFSSYL